MMRTRNVQRSTCNAPRYLLVALIVAAPVTLAAQSSPLPDYHSAGFWLGEREGADLEVSGGGLGLGAGIVWFPSK